MYIRVSNCALDKYYTTTTSALHTPSTSLCSYPTYFTYNMHFSTLLLSTLAAVATAAPVSSTEKRQLLQDVSPDAAGLVSGLGLPTVGIPVGGIVDTVGQDVKRQLLQDASPDVSGLVTGLGLPTVAAPVGGIVDTAGKDVKRQLLQDASPDVSGLVTGLGLPTVAAPVGGIVDTAGQDV
jgi:hypothetical protein